MNRQQQEEKADYHHLLEMLRLRVAANRHRAQRRQQLSKLKRQIEGKRTPES